MPRVGVGGIAAAAARRRREENNVANSPNGVRARAQDPSSNHTSGATRNDSHPDHGISSLRAPHSHPRLLQEESNPTIRFGFPPLDDDDDDDNFFDADDGTTVEQRHGEKKARKPKPWYKKHWFPKRLRLACGAVVENEPFQLVIVALISINAIMLGLQTFDFIEDNPKASTAFELCDFIFLVIFTVELVLQFIYRDWRIFLDAWVTFDFVIILLSWSFNDLQVIRAFRIFRALRLISRVQTLRNLVEALCSVMPKMACIGALLGLVFYIFAVMFTNLFRFSYVDGYTSYDYFSTLDASLFTLFQIMTMDNWAEICRECMQQYTWAWCPFVVFVVASGFVVVNLIIAVICDSVASLNEIADNGTKTSEIDEQESPVDAVSRERILQQEIDDLTVMLEQMQASQYQGSKALEHLTIQLREAGVVNPIGNDSVRASARDGVCVLSL